MKRFLFSFILSLSFAFANSVPITWTGIIGDGKWGTAGNWSTLSVPTAGDDVIFTAVSITVEMDVLPVVTPFTYTINSLLITLNSNVTLQRTQAGGGTRILQLTSTSSSPKGLQIDNGSTLIMDAINTTTGTLNYELALTGGIAVTGEVSGNLYFKGSGVAGTCSAEIDLQDDVIHYGALVVKNPGLIKYFINTGNTSPSNGSYLTMESGSTYELEKNGGSFPPGNWNPNSLAKVSGAGTDPASFNGNSYGNLEWDRPNQTVASFLNADVSFNNVNLISTNSSRFSVKTGGSAGNYTMIINGNLDISSTSYLEAISGSSIAGTSGKISLKGNLNNQGILGSNGIAGTTGQFELSGSSNQNITNGGFVVGIRLEFIMNGVSATLLTPLTLPGINLATGQNLQLINGKIITTSTNILTMIDDGTVSSGSTNSFVSGPMIKKGNDNFIFPIGVGSIYAPIGITNVSGQSLGDVFTAEYIRANPQSTTPYGPMVVGGMDHVSYVEYWTLTQNSGASTKKVSLDVHPLSFCKVLAQTYVSRWSSSSSFWTNEGSTVVYGTPSGSFETGTITSTTASISNFVAPNNAFTLITDLDETANPLPIHLITFDASKLTNTKSSINWELAACCSAAAKFEIQRAGADKGFVTIGTVGGSETNKLYNYIDNGLKNGINYYRLKMIDEDGKITYSRTVAVMNGVNGLLLTSLIPTIVNNTAILTVASSGQQRLDLIITDMQGNVVRRQNYSVVAGNTSIELSMGQRLSAGVYQLIGISSQGKTNTIRFLKQ